MTYISSEEVANLPEDPEVAFVALEAIVRQRYRAQLSLLDEEESVLPAMHQYMSVVLPAARHYEIEPLLGWSPPVEGSNNEYAQYSAFMRTVDYCLSDLTLRTAARTRRFSVKLDPGTKSKLGQMLQQIRQSVEKSDLAEDKRERLLARINALQDEIDRDRTRFDAVGALFVDACKFAGDGAKALEPVVRLIERIGAALGVAKDAEDARPRQLPKPPKAPKQIPHKPSGGNGSNTEEIPF